MMPPGRLLAALTLCLLATVESVHADGPEWFTTLNQARSAAGRSRKPILCIVAKTSDRNSGESRYECAYATGIFDSFLSPSCDSSAGQSTC